jgi:formiminotetrahydrofolate cyclodeaminase
LRVAAVAKRTAVARLAATQGLTIQAVRVPMQVMRQLRVAAADMKAAAEARRAAAAVDMQAAADIGNPYQLRQAADDARSGGA